MMVYSDIVQALYSLFPYHPTPHPSFLANSIPVPLSCAINGLIIEKIIILLNFTTQETITVNPKAYRLPHHATPSRYDIQISARPDVEDFHGKVTIQLGVTEPCDTIEIHARELHLSDAIITIQGAMRAGIIHQDNEREMAAIRFGEPLLPGDATLEITFAGKVSKNMEALYYASDGVESCLCTQCEETDARGIFPCFDEPTFKAQFAWEVTTDPKLTVLANGPLLGTTESEDGKSKTWRFAPTKPMSSYLVALVIGDIASTPEETVAGVPLRVWAMRGKEKMGQYALEYTKRLLPWYNDYFGVPYHFDKYDQVAVPGFAAGAMENSGLVLFRQIYLLMNPQTSSWNQEKSIAAVVAHEFAHMWFGNLVTMKWWDDLWLNEAFAEWMANKVVNTLNPEYKQWHDFVSGSMANALDTDALQSTHSIYSPVETPAEATELFDVITYEKGCAVLRMLESFLGEEAFRAGLRTYMKEFYESNAAGADLWQHLQQASNHPVTDIMESWIKQPGYPVVSFSLQEDGQIRLSQQRFLLKQSNDEGRMTNEQSPSSFVIGHSSSTQSWQVPLIIRYEDDAGVHEVRQVLSGWEEALSLKIEGTVRWCYANADVIGFYRLNPDDASLHALLANLDKLSPLEQVGLFSDQWALTRSGVQSMSKFLDVASNMSHLRNYSLLSKMAGTFINIERMLEDAGDRVALNNFRRWLDNSFKERLTELGYEPKDGESPEEMQSRITLIDIIAGRAHDKEAIEQCNTYADREAANSASVDGNLAPVFVYLAAQFGDRERMDRYVQTYQRRKTAGVSPQETNRYLSSLPAFRAPELVTRTLELIDEKVVPQESVGPILSGHMLPQRHAQGQAWEYIKRHWAWLRETLGDSWIYNIVESSGSLPADKRKEIVSFYKEKLQDLGDKSLARALERMDLRTEFQARARDELVAWFKAQ